MNDAASSSIVTALMATIFYMTLVFITYIIFKHTISTLVSNVKKKKSLLLIENGYSIETFDKNGIPHLLRKGSLIEDVWKLSKIAKGDKKRA